MATKSNLELPVLGGVLGSLVKSAPPTLEEARRTLGGAWEGGPDVGETVRVPGPLGPRVGVVVHASPTHRDVWIGAGRLQRVPAAQAEVIAPDADLGAIAADARVFGGLAEGQRVAYEARDGTVGEGTLVEKLRFGALIARESEAILAVSFRKLTPLGDGQSS